MHVGKLIEILQKADPAAPVRFWVDSGTEADLITIYDDNRDDNEEDEFPVSLGADCVNIDLELLEELNGYSETDDESIPYYGAGDDGD